MLRAFSELSLHRKDWIPFPLFLIYWLECGCASEPMWAMGRRARRVGRATRWQSNTIRGLWQTEATKIGYNQTGYILKEIWMHILLESLLSWHFGLFDFYPNHYVTQCTKTIWTAMYMEPLKMGLLLTEYLFAMIKPCWRTLDLNLWHRFQIPPLFPFTLYFSPTAGNPGYLFPEMKLEVIPFSSPDRELLYCKGI